MHQIAGLAQQQTLSPQMQQSLHILQAPLMELRHLIAAELQSNPLLEEERKSSVESNSEAPEQQTPTSEFADSWTTVHSQGQFDQERADRRQFFFDSQTRGIPLSEYLSEQVALAGWTEKEQLIARFLAGNLNEEGYLTCPLEEIAQQAGCFPHEVEKLLPRFQEIIPGVGARDLRECLVRQLQANGRRYGLEIKIVQYHLEELARRKFLDIARALHVNEEQVHQAAARIARLNPKPGLAWATAPEQTIIPDVIVEKDGDEFVVTLNDSDLPNLRINNDYKDLIATGETSREVQDYVREKIRGGRFFIRSIEQRQQTIQRIAGQIVDRQKEFMQSGPEHLRPMNMSQIAETIGVHETTVSRALTGKYMRTPQGIFEMKYFFTQGFQTAEGESVSNASVRHAIAELIQSEDTKKPFSDQDLVGILKDRGIPVARRTIAKYREQLGILPSHLRKAY